MPGLLRDASYKEKLPTFLTLRGSNGIYSSPDRYYFFAFYCIGFYLTQARVRLPFWLRRKRPANRGHPAGSRASPEHSRSPYDARERTEPNKASTRRSLHKTTAVAKAVPRAEPAPAPVAATKEKCPLWKVKPRRLPRMKRPSPWLNRWPRPVKVTTDSGRFESIQNGCVTQPYTVACDTLGKLAERF